MKVEYWCVKCDQSNEVDVPNFTTVEKLDELITEKHEKEENCKRRNSDIFMRLDV